MSLWSILDFKKWKWDKDSIQTFYFISFLFFWLIRYFNDLWLFQQLSPPVFYTGFDLSFSLANNLSIVHIISESFTLSLFIDLSLIGLAFAALFWKQKSWINILFSIVLLCYIFIHYGALGAHKHNLSGLWFTSLIFWWKKDIQFSLAFRSLRIFGIYAYGTAGLWKLIRHCFFYQNYFSTIL